jgi:hypothetical protein
VYLSKINWFLPIAIIFPFCIAMASATEKLLSTVYITPLLKIKSTLTFCLQENKTSNINKDAKRFLSLSGCINVMLKLFSNLLQLAVRDFLTLKQSIINV